MSKRRLKAGVFAGTRCVFILVLALSQYRSIRAEQGEVEGARGAPAALRPLSPPPRQPKNVIALSDVEQLGKDIFYDHTLSNPAGYACATCHAPQTGFTGPSSVVNKKAGPVPGVVPGRFGKRKPQTAAYAAFSPVGPTYHPELQVWLGGTFWDGRTPDTTGQARMPFLDQNEMANTPEGPYPPHSGGFGPLVAEKLKQRPYAALFPKVFGADAFSSATDADIYAFATQAIAAYEASAEICQFSSKYDASPFGVLQLNKYRLTPSEENGRKLFFNAAQCSQCHSSVTLHPGEQPAPIFHSGGNDLFTMDCYANIGVPKNPANPFYQQTDAASNPYGYNSLGKDFIDYGLGMNPNPAPDGTLFMNTTPGDIQQFRGLFKAPTLRNVGKRSSLAFVKSFMHNGVFKSLKEVVHFYNKRNIAADKEGHEAAFDLRAGPPAGYVPLFPPPEVLDNVQNVAGVTRADATGDVASNGQVGNLGLTPREEDDLVSFLKILTDGYTSPNPVSIP